MARLICPGRGRTSTVPTVRQSDPELQAESFVLGQLASLRRAGDEAQWTQFIAATGSDELFAAAFAVAILKRAPRTPAAALAEVPAKLLCRAEVTMVGAGGQDLGRADLVFEDLEQRDFILIVELKLDASYGVGQLDRYRQALDAMPHRSKYLAAITKTQPLSGENVVADSPSWLGSLRWFELYEDLHDVVPHDGLGSSVWRSALQLLRRQGDFGPMDFDPQLLAAWARRREAEDFIRSLLQQLALPTLELVRQNTGQGADDEAAASMLARGKYKSQPIVPWYTNMHIDYAVPSHAGEARLRIQFVAFDGVPHFTVEARYQHSVGELDEDDAVDAATQSLRRDGFRTGHDGYGYYWATVRPTAEIVQGPDALDQLQAMIAQAVDSLASSGIFEALHRHPARSAVLPSPVEE